MPDELEKYLAEQEAKELAEWDTHIDKRHEARRVARQRPSYGRDRKSVVDELETGSDEIAAMDNVFTKGDNSPT